MHGSTWCYFDEGVIEHNSKCFTIKVHFVQETDMARFVFYTRNRYAYSTNDSLGTLDERTSSCIQT